MLTSDRYLNLVVPKCQQIVVIDFGALAPFQRLTFAHLFIALVYQGIICTGVSDVITIIAIFDFRMFA